MKRTFFKKRYLVAGGFVLAFVLFGIFFLLSRETPTPGNIRTVADMQDTYEDPDLGLVSYDLTPELGIVFDTDEHIYGNKEAVLFLVEYADIDCPFCAQLHPVFKKIVDESGGRVAWVYRHNPLLHRHPEAFTKAVATECVARLSGNEAFWEYLNDLSEGASIDVYQTYDIDTNSFEGCIANGASDQAVNNDQERAHAVGAYSTPQTIITDGNGGVIVRGAQPRVVWERMIKVFLDK